MSSPLYRIQHLQEALEKQWLILTPNRRLASKIRQAWALAHPDRVMPNPPILGLEDWLSQLHSELNTKLNLLTPLQQQLCWEQVINQLNHGLLMSDRAIAQLFASADELLCLWGIPYKSLPNDPDGELLKNAIAKFEWKLRELHSTTLNRSIDCLKNQIKTASKTIPEKIVLTGFDTLAPLFSEFLQTLPCPIITLEIHSDQNSAQQISLADPEQEITAAAIWAKQKLVAAVDKNKVRIGIIVPDLNLRRSTVERIFQNVFEPHYQYPDIPRYSSPFNISAGESLSQQPIIACALELLQTNSPERPLTSLLFLINSPFWSDDTDALSSRIYIENIARSFQQENVSLQSISNKITQPIFFKTAFKKQQSILTSGKKAPSEWIDTIQDILKNWGWPGSRRLDSIEYQQVKHFQDCLDQLIQADNIFANLSFTETIQLLNNICLETDFQAQTKDSPIQILGVLEGSALHFDHAWLCGMSEQNWPPSISPHPLLPATLQINSNMPHCSAEREFIFCQKISAHLLKNSKEIMISFPETLDETSQSVSCFFKNLPKIQADNLFDKDESKQYIQKMIECKKLEVIQDDKAPLFTSDKVKGGIGILKSQANCPMDAFAKYRLGAEPLLEPELGLSHRTRGNLVHNSLYFFWKSLLQEQIDNLHDFLSLSKSSKIAHIKKSALYAIGKEDHPLLKNEFFKGIELQRLKKYLGLWLEEESKRPPFQVHDLEKRTHYQLAGIELQLTIDRIDKFIDKEILSNNLFLIDYKTGKTLSSNDWLDSPPKEPQLPLYALVETEALGIAYGQINAHGAKFISMGAHPNIPALNPKAMLDEDAWNQKKNNWQVSLETLMQSFKDGEAVVQYRNENQIADHQKLYQAFNRWPEKEYIDQLVRDDIK